MAQVKKQQKQLLETTCAMKSLKYAISSLQKECSDAFVPDCGALTCFKGSNRSGRSKPMHKITQTVEDVDSYSNTAFKDGISSGTFFSAAHNDSSLRP